VFASPARLGRQPWSYDQVWCSFLSAAAASGIDKPGTHSMRHTYRSWLDAAGTTVAVQQKLMRHGDIRTTMNVYGDVIANEMQEAHSKVVQMALSKPNCFASDLRVCKLLKNGGSEWGVEPTDDE
jgi:integrase